jgi:hypothetical protein
MMPDKASQVTETEVPNAPAKQDEPRTEAGSDQKDLMSFLDIPADVQGQLKPREVPTELPGDVPAPPVDQPAPTEQPAPDEEADEPEEEEEQEPVAAQSEQPQKVDKRQKRINRLTRQKGELQDKLDAEAAKAEELRQKLAQYEGRQQQQGPPVPSDIGRLGWITTEQQLAQEYNKAQSVIDWCDKNETGQYLTDEQIADPYKESVEKGELLPEEAKARTVAFWRREADRLVTTAPMRREELRQYAAVRNHYDGLVKQSWPELLDKSSPDYQIAQSIKAQYPFLTSMPQGDYAVALLIEGAKAVDARNAAGNGQRRQHRDIDERAFGPRVPISPHVANPPTRTAAPSSKQRLNEAMDNLVKDPDGSATSLANAFGALDAARPGQRPTGKTAVRS